MEKEHKFNTLEMYELLEKRFSDRNQFVTVREVGLTTGFSMRRLDFVTVNCYESKNLSIDGYEVKISVSDMMHDLQNPAKHNVFYDSIDTYSLCAPRYVINSQPLEVYPPHWGLLEAFVDEEGNKALKWKRKPKPLNDKPHDVPKPFFASLLRAVATRGSSERERLEIERKMREEVEKEVRQRVTGGAKLVDSKYLEELQRDHEACRKLGIFSERHAEEMAKTLKHIDNANFDVKMVKRMSKELTEQADRVAETADALAKAFGLDMQEEGK